MAELSSVGIDRGASDPHRVRAWRWAVGAGAVLLVWAYAPSLSDLSTT